MSRESVKNGKLLYHLTDIGNLENILKEGLLSRNRLVGDIRFNDIADKQIISKRNSMGLGDYIPFHFHPYSSFDVAVKNIYSEKEFIYICITRKLAIYNNFKVLPNHPLSNGDVSEYNLLEYDEGFKKIDWQAMDTLGTEDKYIKQVKMAECLTQLTIPAKCFQSIAVRNDEIRKYVKERLKCHGIINKPPYVDIREWF